MDLTDAIKNSIPVSLFKFKPAEEIFSDVKKCGAKIVIKDDLPECILLSPAEYVKIMEELDYLRQEKLISDDRLSSDTLLDELDLSDEDLNMLDRIKKPEPVIR